MKTKLLIAIAILVNTMSYAQANLLGIHWTGSRELFSKLDIPTSSATDLDTLHGVSSIAQGLSTYDPVHNIYFHSTTIGIAVVDGSTGHFIDTLILPNSVSLMNMEYDPVSDKLLGVHWTGGREFFSSVDISTGAYTDIDTLQGVTSLAQGISAFDPFNGRYFISSNLGIMIIDAVSGAILDTIPYTVNLSEIEYDPNSDKLFGVHWDGTREMFASLDISSKTYTDIDTLNGVSGIVQGNSTFDPILSIYYISTTSGILAIDPSTGSVLYTYSNSGSLTGLEADYHNVILSLNGQPQSQAASIADHVQFQVSTTEPSPVYQWQSSNGSGFKNMSDGGQYSGVKGPALDISNLTMANDKQQFRCIITSGAYSNPSHIASLRINKPTGIPKAAAPGAFVVFTSVATSEVVVKANRDANGVGYVIYDQAGKSVLSGQLNAKISRIDLGGLAAGLYLLRLDDASGQTFKIARP